MVESDDVPSLGDIVLVELNAASLLAEGSVRALLFAMPRDKDEAYLAEHGGDLWSVLWDLIEKHLRPMTAHKQRPEEWQPEDGMDDLPVELTPDEVRALEYVKQLVLRLCEDNDVDLYGVK